MAKRGKTDWEALKAEYAAGSMSYREMAAAHGLAQSSVNKMAKAMDWVGARARWRRDSAAAAVRACGRARKKELESVMDSAGRMAKHLERVLADDEQFYRQVMEVKQYDKQGRFCGKKMQEVRTQKADSRAMSDIARALRELAGTMQGLLDASEDGRSEVRVVMDAETEDFAK